MIVRKLGYEFNVEPGQVKGDGYFWDLVNSGGWEEELFKSLVKYLSPDSVYIDIGSWIGPTVLFANKLTTRVYAIEPDSLALEALKTNISLNPGSTIHVSNVAISSYSGEANLGTLGVKGDSTSSILPNCHLAIPSTVTTDRVSCLTLYDYLNYINVGRVNFLKIDIEGGEILILENLTSLYKTIGSPIIHLSIHQKFFPNKKDGINKVLRFIRDFDVPEDIKDKILKEDFTDVLLKPI